MSTTQVAQLTTAWKSISCVSILSARFDGSPAGEAWASGTPMALAPWFTIWNLSCADRRTRSGLTAIGCVPNGHASMLLWWRCTQRTQAVGVEYERLGSRR
jgi:hypothetical protein